MQTPVRELGTGSTFAGRYQIIEELGKGGMGRVYKVFDTKIKEKVALKLIKPEVASEEETIERFSSEIRLARKIGHRNVCKMFDIGEADGAHFITMEYVHGEDLKSMIHMSGSLSVGMILSVGKQICDGLAEAHSLGVVHRDLKPQNIMIDKNGNAKIMDFGIARSIKDKGITGAGIMIGTPEYMSPEQAEAKDVDHRSDIYSLGIILYEMATSRVPFDGETPLSIAMKHKGEMPKKPKHLNPGIPDGLNGVILRCLEKNKADRYQSAAEVETELEKIEKGLPITERKIPERKPFTSKEITVKFQLKKLILPVLGTAALAILAVILLSVAPKKRYTPAASGRPSLAVVYFENISGDPALEGWKTGFPELLITDLSQSKFLNVLGGDRIYSIIKKLDLIQARKYSSEDLARVADEGGAEYVLSGGLMKAGPKIIVTVRLQKPHTGEVIRSEKVECDGEADIAPKVDELTRMIKADFKLTPQQIASDMDKEVGTITTASPEAYRYYSEARKFHLAQDYYPAMRLYEKAVAVDPDFAMAYRGMAALYSNGGNVPQMRECIKKALDLSGRVSEKERLMIEGQYYYHLSENSFDKAIDAFQKMLELYPDDVFANQYLGEIYHDLEEPEKAKEYHMAAYINAKEIIHAWNVFHDYQGLGQYDQAQKVFEDILPQFSDDPFIHSYLALNYFYQGKYDLALREGDKAFLRSPDSSWISLGKGLTYMLQDDFAAAEKELQTLAEKEQEPWRARARSDLASLEVAKGRWEKAKAVIRESIASANRRGDRISQADLKSRLAYCEFRTGHSDEAMRVLEEALKIYREMDIVSGQRTVLALRGVIAAEQGALEKARQTTGELEALVQKGLNRKAIRLCDLIEGCIELKNGDPSKAIGNFQKAISLLPAQCDPGDSHAVFLEPLARAYEKAGDLEKAEAEYEKITRLTSGRLGFGDIYARAFYSLGKIAEKQREKAKAAGLYRKFLDLWKDADPGLAEVADARQRLEKIRD